MSIYEVAFFLKIPIYQLADEMPYEELLGWMDYFDRRPIGWRDDNRAFRVMQSNGCEAKGPSVFPSLGVIYEGAHKAREEGQVSVSNLKGSFLFHKMLDAKGGDTLDFNNGNED